MVVTVLSVILGFPLGQSRDTGDSLLFTVMEMVTFSTGLLVTW